MYLLIVFLPIIIFVLSSLYAKAFGRFWASLINVAAVAIVFFLSLFAFYEVILCGAVVTIDLFNWFVFEGVCVSWGFLFDSLTVSMLLIVTLVSSLVHLYSLDYMSGDPHLNRFLNYLTLFTFFMIVLVTSSNYLQLFVGWEGVGLVSYLLVNFWHTRIQANKAALKAILVNRVGDFFFFFGMVTALMLFNSLNYEVVFSLLPFYVNDKVFLFGTEFSTLSLISLFFFLGAVGKSAQLGLHTWLPDAMEGPTPVSALIHAATMVTAGVFLLLRSAPLIEYCPSILDLMVIVGGLTAFAGASIGLFQDDLKKIIAYSTCSQLGYMVLACGVSAYNVSLYHLVNHAFFKALLFLSAGCVIHSMSNEQDMRRMGGLRVLLPISYVMLLIGSLSLMGFPFFTGFYSKDALLEVVFVSTSTYADVAYVLALSTAAITAFYSFRLLFITFFGKPSGRKVVYEHCHESSTNMLVSLVVLGVFSVFAGYMLKDIFIGLGSPAWINAFGSGIIHQPLFDAEYILQVFKMLPVIVSLGVVFFAMYYEAVYYFFNGNVTFVNARALPYLLSFRLWGIVSPRCAEVANDLYTFGMSNPSEYDTVNTRYARESVYNFFAKKLYIDIIYNKYVSFGVLKFSYEVLKRVDRGLFEHVGPTSVVNYVYSFNRMVSGLQSGPIYIYLAHMVLGLVVLLSFLYSSVYLSVYFDDYVIVLVYCLLSLNSVKYFYYGGRRKVD
jgi:NADH-ubiquinone oxidoreductase chain 5